MRKFLVEVQFFGKQYAGFQINGDKKTIEKEIEESLLKLFGQPIKIDGCSRTDSGVSARQFFFTFSVDTKLPADRIAYKLNRFLSNEIKCQDSKEVDLKFNLRRSIECKTYEYKIYTGNHIQPLLNRYAVFINENLDVQKMKDCAKTLLGKHNFKSFCNYNPDISTYDRNLRDIKILQNGDEITFYITADGFLYNMVRILVGTLIECGKNKCDQEKIYELFKAEDRGKNPAITMSPKGLTLYSVQFKE